MTVILVDSRHPSMVPVEAVGLLAGDLQYTEELPVRLAWTLSTARPVYIGEDAPALLSSDRSHPEVKARIEAGAKVIEPPARQGEKLIDAVAVMDRLRTKGPWESAQTHDSLRRYLLEETYELFDAVRTGNADELREELGDVLLQVLFHARIAEDAPEHPFNIDDVADALLTKLGNRIPVLLGAGGDTASISLEEQLAQWEERKAQEKDRDSCLDGVSSSQPALALTQKVLGRVTAAGLPAELIPAQLLSVTIDPDGDAENHLRADVLEFMDTVRRAERDILSGRRGADVASELDVSDLRAVGAEEWRARWRQVPEERDVEGTAAEESMQVTAAE
ncbi:nucleoside triphosphate pyrophosphohydrolase [Mycobacterium sp. CBMA271]|uniref:nucleoside triphosphate pyrophosphohydrolase n=1 Tax=unclassified Mycobacteroides TaxID=2618759 RepID=UPI0012DD5359|nr:MULTISPECIES: nucleoside triphosphate pyrophosphohydrolase [unclassified Mycobacteroides]MUM15632.1 nucleoside triphosphate hydrolase [Mycobacteroides sp. CBMA 326]MUM17427.1 nucleoside triphosphate hydrolase [Mycobacteroides sp. CBMA 326]MUM21902.1 nucleoside triphosphate pyrophosphohydrolase [Mycobacteroides sp. CBMA 271]